MNIRESSRPRATKPAGRSNGPRPSNEQSIRDRFVPTSLDYAPPTDPVPSFLPVAGALFFGGAGYCLGGGAGAVVGAVLGAIGVNMTFERQPSGR